VLTPKVAHYGLPAAGVLSLALLRPSSSGEITDNRISIPKVLQNLSVLVVEIQMGGFVQPGEPNYALLHRAACTIETLLQRLFTSSTSTRASDRGFEALGDVAAGASGGGADFDVAASAGTVVDLFPPGSFIWGDTWGYDQDFWKMIGEHPSLLTSADHAQSY